MRSLYAFYSLLALIVFLGAGLAFASAPTSKDPSATNPDDRESCQTPHGALTLIFDSPSNNFEKRDTLVSVKTGGRTLKLPLEGAYYNGPEAMKASSLCETTPALMVDSDRAIFFLSKQTREKTQKLVGFILNVKFKKLEAVSSDLGSGEPKMDEYGVRESFVAEKIEKGARILIYRGHKLVDGKREPLFHWKTVTVENGVMKQAWELPLPPGFTESAGG